jgi:diaminohydroxyphosphoribosylaminopyrimidine deaminase/5-amino-6-(5-phosphoribosylamino)uracil reductase
VRVVVGRRAVPADARVRTGPGTWHHAATHDVAAVLTDLARRGARRVLLEGGPTLLGSALRAGLVDELHAYVAPVLLGTGTDVVPDLGVTTLSGASRWRTTHTERLGDDVLIVARRNEGES